MFCVSFSLLPPWQNKVYILFVNWLLKERYQLFYDSMPVKLLIVHVRVYSEQDDVWTKPVREWVRQRWGRNLWRFGACWSLPIKKYISPANVMKNSAIIWQKRDHPIHIIIMLKASKCPPSAKTRAGWSHLIWHNFVTVGDNWIKICSSVDGNV